MVPVAAVWAVFALRIIVAFAQGNTEDRVSLSLGECFLHVSEPCSPDKISFHLFTRFSGDEYKTITETDCAPPPGFNPLAETKVLIHGYAGSLDFKAMVDVRKAYQEAGDYNVVVVDWSILARLPCYPAAVANTLQAGRCTSSLLSNLARVSGTNASDFHAVGFSLGAHVAAFASNELQRIRGLRLRRITGLDPALPFFASLSKSWKLDRRDADFVDVIHTNAGVFGKIEPTGHADFYVNAGTSQPACANSSNVPLCSHKMALTYFAESIRTPPGMGFWGVACTGYVPQAIGWCERAPAPNRALMGEQCNRRTRGVYLVTTREQPPYAIGQTSRSVPSHRDLPLVQH